MGKGATEDIMEASGIIYMRAASEMILLNYYPFSKYDNGIIVI